MARTFMEANRRPMKNASFRFPPMRTKNNKKNDKVKPLTGPQRQLWTKFQNTMLLDAVVCWGEKLNYKICSSVALATHSREMQFTITKCRQQLVRGRDAFPENMHNVVLKVHDDLAKGMGPLLHWMHTGELILKKENFEDVVTAATALKVTVLRRKLSEIAKDYEFHWVELPENAKEKERRAKREAARKAKAEAKESEEKEAENEEEPAEDDAEMEDDVEEEAEEETNEEETNEEKPAEQAQVEIDPSFKKIGGQEMLDKIKSLRRIQYFTEVPDDSVLYKTHIKRYTQQNRQSGNKPDNKRSNDDKTKTDNNKRQRTNTGSTTTKREWTSKSTQNGRQIKREAQSSQSIYRAQPVQPQPQMYQPPIYQQPPQQAAYYGQPQAYQYQPPQQYHQQYQPPQPTWQNQGRRY